MDGIFVVLLVTAIVLALTLALRLRAPIVGGARAAANRGARTAASRGARGPDPAKSPHVVVDTLNLTHWLLSRGGSPTKPHSLTPELIVGAIDRTAPLLRARHAGRVMYVLKDRESQFNDEATRAMYREAAVRNRVYILAAQRYAEPPRSEAERARGHSTRGRDDFFLALLAKRWHCAVLTADKLRDFAELRGAVQPFYVDEFAFWRDGFVREQVRPDSPAFYGMRKPRLIPPAEYFGDLFGKKGDVDG